MGNDTLINNYLSKKHEKEIINDIIQKEYNNNNIIINNSNFTIYDVLEIRLKNIFSSACQNEYFILNKNEFNLIVKIGNDKILNNLFDAFSVKNKMNFYNFKLFYIFFESNYKEDFLVLCSYLIFGKKNYIDEKNYNKNVEDIFYDSENLKSIFIYDKFIKSIKEKIKEKELLSKKLFLEKVKLSKSELEEETETKKKGKSKKSKNKNNSDESVKFNLMKLEGSSTFETQDMKSIDLNNINFCCDCDINLENDKIEKEIENLNSMKSSFNFLSFLQLENYLDELNIDKFFQKIIFNYFKNLTYKEQINFETFKNFILNFINFKKDLNEIEVNNKRKKFIFTMLSFPNQTIKKNVILDNLELKNLNSNLEIFNDIQFLEIKEFDENEETHEKIFNEFGKKINYIFELMDLISLIPYKNFNVRTENMDTKRKILNMELKNLSIKEYFNKVFLTEKVFYIINSSFWEEFYINKKDVFEINNEEIIENNRLKKGKIYTKDFYIVNNRIYEILKNQFVLKNNLKLYKYENETDENEIIDFSNEITNGFFILEKLIEIEVNNNNKNNINEQNKNEKENLNESNKNEVNNEKNNEENKNNNNENINKENSDLNNEKNIPLIKKKKILHILDFQPIFIYITNMDFYIDYVKEKKAEKMYKKKYHIFSTLKNILIKMEYNNNRQYEIYKIKSQIELDINKFDEFLKKNCNINNINDKENKMREIDRNISFIPICRKEKIIEIINEIFRTITNSFGINNFKIYIYKENQLLDQDYILSNLKDINISEDTLVYFAQYHNKNETEYDISKRNNKKKEKNNNDINEFEVIDNNDIPKEESKLQKKEQEKMRKELKKKEDEKKKELEKKQKEEEKKEKEKEKKLEEELKIKMKEVIHPPFGLKNFGNTCYFNSISQIFFNCPPLQNLFINNPKIKYFINKNNKFGQKGKFLSLFLNMYTIQRGQVNEGINNLKKFVGKINSDFDNNMQQDANELLILFLENLHEELNLKSERKYIEDNDKLYLYNTEDEIGNIHWSNSQRRASSFINSLFMFQLKSNLRCTVCKKKKVNFETNYVIDLPLLMNRVVKCEIKLYKLPYYLKVYLDIINEKFHQYNIDNKMDSNNQVNVLKDNLKEYYLKFTKEELQREKYDVNIYKFVVDIEREEKFGTIVKILKGIQKLDLEYYEKEKNIEKKIDEDDIKEYIIDEYSSLIVECKGAIRGYEESIEKYISQNDQLYIEIHEVLNTKGLFKLFGIDNKLNYLYYEFNRENIKSFENCIEKTNNINNNIENAIISSSNYLSYYLKNPNNIKLINLPIEIVIPVFHFCYGKINQNYLFNRYEINKLNLPNQFVIINKTNNQNHFIFPVFLYSYIWILNYHYINIANKKTDEFWWLNNRSKNKCYPFVLRMVKFENKFSNQPKCAICPWFRFCPGCIINPFKKEPLQLPVNCSIVVDWCYRILTNEISSRATKNIYEINYEEMKEYFESSFEKKNMSIEDCYNLFCAEEKLEDELTCNYCNDRKFFTKYYEMHRLPYILILSLKRFKYNEVNRFKLSQMIKYPLKNFILKNKSYDLYGVVNHYGGINSGHYIAIVKNGNRWLTCDDSNVYEIEENRVMNSNAYILVYILNEKIEDYDKYYNNLKDIMDNIIEDEKHFIEIKKSKNFYEGEPVKTDYGEGYVMNDSLQNDKYVRVKLEYFYISVIKSKVIKQTVLNYKEK